MHVDTSDTVLVLKEDDNESELEINLIGDLQHGGYHNNFCIQ